MVDLQASTQRPCTPFGASASEQLKINEIYTQIQSLFSFDGDLANEDILFGIPVEKIAHISFNVVNVVMW